MNSVGWPELPASQGHFPLGLLAPGGAHCGIRPNPGRNSALRAPLRSVRAPREDAATWQYADIHHVCERPPVPGDGIRNAPRDLPASPTWRAQGESPADGTMPPCPYRPSPARKARKCPRSLLPPRRLPYIIYATVTTELPQLVPLGEHQPRGDFHLTAHERKETSRTRPCRRGSNPTGYVTP